MSSRFLGPSPNDILSCMANASGKLATLDNLVAKTRIWRFRLNSLLREDKLIAKYVWRMPVSLHWEQRVQFSTKTWCRVSSMMNDLHISQQIRGWSSVLSIGSMIAISVAEEKKKKKKQQRRKILLKSTLIGNSMVFHQIPHINLRVGTLLCHYWIVQVCTQRQKSILSARQFLAGNFHWHWPEGTTLHCIKKAIVPDTFAGLNDH